MRIYISGKITGMDYADAFTLFDQAENILALAGHMPVNPMKSEGETPGKRWAEYIAEDVLLIDQCDAIYMMANWQTSDGAKVERHLCEVLGKPIFYAASEIPTA